MYSYKVCQKTSAEDQSPSRWIKHQLSILGLYLEILLATSDPLLYDLSFRSHSEVQSTGRSPNRRADELDQRALAGPDSLNSLKWYTYRYVEDSLSALLRMTSSLHVTNLFHGAQLHVTMMLSGKCKMTHIDTPCMPYMPTLGWFGGSM